jgi:hypothetical protein
MCVCVCVCACVCVCVSNLISLELLLFYLIHLYMFRAFLAHHQEILYCLVSRNGKRKWHCLSVYTPTVPWKD